MATVTVASGDCVSSLAVEAGLTTRRVCDANPALAEKRDNANVLNPGDVVQLPERDPQVLDRPTAQHHRFRRLTETTCLRLKLLRPDLTARANLGYKLTIDDADTRHSSTDADGMLEQHIPGAARQVTIAFQENGNVESYLLPLGCIRPVETIQGVQQRLLNLGFDCGPVDGVWGRRSTAAMREYQLQRHVKRQPDGQADAVSRTNLKGLHGC